MRMIPAGRDPHAEQLERACLQALAEGRVEDAFRNIDRRCRIPPLPRPYHYVLRAETLSRMGDGKGALADIARALELAPEDIQANRRMLAWGEGDAQCEAARILIGRDPDTAVLVDAMNVLRRAGVRAIASLRAFDDVVAGWAAWDGDENLEITGTSLSAVRILPQAEHPLRPAKFEHVADIELDRPRSPSTQTINLYRHGECFYSIHAPANESSRGREVVETIASQARTEDMSAPRLHQTTAS
jgi:O-antigen biosynthesis protein